MLTVYICYSPAGRSVLGETVPEVLSTRTEGTVSPNTNRPRPVNHIFIFFVLRFKSLRNFSLQTMCVEEGCIRVELLFKAHYRLQTKTKYYNLIFNL